MFRKFYNKNLNPPTVNNKINQIPYKKIIIESVGKYILTAVKNHSVGLFMISRLIYIRLINII